MTKVFELAKELGVESKEICQEFEIKSHLSKLSESQIVEIKSHYGKEPVVEALEKKSEVPEPAGNEFYADGEIIARKGNTITVNNGRIIYDIKLPEK